MSDDRLVKLPTQTQTYPARFSSLDPVREFVGQQAVTCGLDEEAVYQVQLAVDEAFSNIVEHSFGGECDEDVECTCQTGPDGLYITLIDCGRPFSPENIPGPDLVSSLSERTVGGLGMYFMRRLMDEVQYEFLYGPDGIPECNVLKMYKRKEPSG